MITHDHDTPKFPDVHHQPADGWGQRGFSVPGICPTRYWSTASKSWTPILDSKLTFAMTHPSHPLFPIKHGESIVSYCKVSHKKNWSKLVEIWLQESNFEILLFFVVDTHSGQMVVLHLAHIKWPPNFVRRLLYTLRLGHRNWEAIEEEVREQWSF